MELDHSDGEQAPGGSGLAADPELILRRAIVDLYGFLVAAARRKYHFSADEAYDLVQGTVELALRYSAHFDGSNAKAWLFAIMHNLFRTNCRKAKVRAVVSLTNDLGDIDAPVPGNQEDSAILKDTLELMQRLPPDQFDALWLLSRGHSYTVAAAATCVPEGTLKSRVARARQTLRRIS